MAGPYVATKYISGFQCGPIYGELAIILEFMYVFGLRNAQTSYETAVATVRLRQRSRRTSLWASLTRCAEHHGFGVFQYGRFGICHCWDV